MKTKETIKRENQFLAEYSELCREHNMYLKPAIKGEDGSTQYIMHSREDADIAWSIDEIKQNQ